MRQWWRIAPPTRLRKNSKNSRTCAGFTKREPSGLMKKLAIAVLAILAVAVAQATLVSVTLAENIEQHTETITIQTVTISDEQFLKGDPSGRPTIISGTLKLAQGSGHLPLVILLHGSGG